MGVKTTLEGSQLDWGTQRWLWRELATREDCRTQLVTRAVWPAVGGEFGPRARVVAAYTLDALAEVWEPEAVKTLVLPPLFALSGVARGDAAPEDETAAISALNALGRAWSRVEELGADSEERLSVFFNDITEHSGARIAEAGAEVLGRIAASRISREVLVGVLTAACRLASVEAHATSISVQTSLARALVTIGRRSPDLEGLGAVATLLRSRLEVGAPSSDISDALLRLSQEAAHAVKAS